MFFFFFSSRRRHTRFKCDWSSDVCSSDLDLRSLLSARCPTCKGNGVTKSDATLAAEVFRAVQAKIGTADDASGREVVVRVHPDLGRYFEGDGQDPLERLARMLDRKITIQPNHPDREGFEVRLRGGGS